MNTLAEIAKAAYAQTTFPRSWRVFLLCKNVSSHSTCQWINTKDTLIDLLEIANIILTVPPLDTPQQSFGTRGDRIYNSANKPDCCSTINYWRWV